MRGRWLAPPLLVSVAALVLVAVLAQIPGYGQRKLISGEWAFDPLVRDQPMLVLADKGPITGFAFGPGRAEVAYCAPVGEDAYGLWLVSATYPKPEEWAGGIVKTSSKPRLLWSAPRGAKLQGPVRWAPEATQIAVRASSEEGNDLVAVDYATGAASWLTRGVDVIEAAWSRGGHRIAYVMEQGNERVVWADTVPAADAQRLGTGGHALRWSVDRKSLSWLQPESEAVWVQVTWQVETGEVTVSNPQPARPAGAIWSPDDRFCAALEASAEGGQKDLMIYRGANAVGERVSLYERRPKEVLGWSPDSRILLVLDEANVMVAVAPEPVPDSIRPLVEFRGGYSRVLGLDAPVEPSAPPPAWSSGGDMLAYVFTTLPSGYPESRLPYGCLVVQGVSSEHVELTTWEREEANRVLSNIKNVALALQMYLADNNDVFPQTGEIGEVRQILDEYVRSQSLFMRPGTEDEVVVQYLVPPGLRFIELEDTASTPVAVVDYLPGYVVVAYGDGHVEMFDKSAGSAPDWEAWWSEFRQRQAGGQP